MDDFMPVAREGRYPARRLTVRGAGAPRAVLREVEGGFVLADPEGGRAAPPLGTIDLHEGGRHVAHGLVVAEGPVEGGTLYRFKRMTRVDAAPPADWAPGMELEAGGAATA